MSEPIEYIDNDAGFSKTRYVHGNGRKVRHPNTQVAALAIFDSFMEETDTSYDEMFVTLSLAMEEWINKPGRRSKVRRVFQEHPGGSLHTYRMPMEFLKPWIEKRWPNLSWVSTTWVGAKTQMHLDRGVFGEEHVLARVSSDQVIPVLAGVAHFPWDPNSSVDEGKSRIVYGYWTMP